MRIICLGFGLAALAAGAVAQAFASSEVLPDSNPTHLQESTRATQKMKPFGEDFDSDNALKISQASIGNTLTGYTFRNRQNQIVNLSDYRGKPLVISLIFTSCFHICPTTTQNIADAVKTARSAVGKDKFSVVTIGFDTLHDTPERMSAYARQQGVGRNPNWSFLSADETTIKRLTADLGFIFTRTTSGFDHLIQTTVIDKDGKIYGQIYGMDFNPGLLTEAMRGLVFGRTLKSLSLSALVNKVRLYCTRYDPSTDAYKFNYAMVFGMISSTIALVLMGIFLVRFLRNS